MSPATPTTPGLWGVWGGAVGGAGTIAGNFNAGKFTYNLAGFAAGIDRRLSPNFLVGVTAGYQTGTQWTAGFDGRGTTDTFQAGLYAGFTEGPLYVDALAGYAYSANRLTRTIAIPGMNTRTAQGQTGANLFYGQLEAGYRVDLGGRMDGYVTPFARLQGVTATQNAFTETVQIHSTSAWRNRRPIRCAPCWARRSAPASSSAGGRNWRCSSSSAGAMNLPHGAAGDGVVRRRTRHTLHGDWRDADA